MRRLILGLAVLLAACGDGTETPPPPAGCPSGDITVDGLCVRAGLPADLPCAPGEWLDEAGSCLPAGVPPDGCGEGFRHDGDRGCEPILPAEACAEGMMAVPGESACREVAPCGTGTWGDIPVDAQTQYVDAGYTGGASDGSSAAPWTAIQAGIDAAASGAVVAVAAGSYQEDLRTIGKAVKLWGRCPSMVELVAVGNQVAALEIVNGAHGSEVHRLAITGPAIGIFLSGVEDVLIDEAWIHGLNDRGINAQTDFGPTSLTMRRSLVERNASVGVFVSSLEATIEASVVRDNQARGVAAELTAAPASLLIQQSLVERNHEDGALALGSVLTLRDSVVRDNVPNAEGRSYGIRAVQGYGAARAALTLQGSLVERGTNSGVFVAGSDAVVENSVVRGVVSSGGSSHASGLHIRHRSDNGARGSLMLERSLVEQVQSLGLLLVASDAIVDATMVRAMQSPPDGAPGRGITIEDEPDTGIRASLTLTRSELAANVGLGLVSVASDVYVRETAVRDTGLVAAGEFGQGMHLEAVVGSATNAEIEASLLERNVEAGILVAGPASLAVEGVEVRDTNANVEGRLGDGLVLMSYYGLVEASVHATRVERSQRAAISSFGASVALGHLRLSCQAFDLAAEPWEGLPPLFADGGHVLCGCPEAADACQAQSYALTPPVVFF